MRTSNKRLESLFCGGVCIVLGLTLAVESVAQTCIAAPPGLVSWWPFDEGNGQVARDIVGSNDGRLGSTEGLDHNDPAFTCSGKVGAALVFDGSDDYIEIPYSSELDFAATTREFTKAAWVKLSSIPEHDMFLFRQERVHIGFTGRGGPSSSSSNPPAGQVMSSIGILDGHGSRVGVCYTGHVPTLNEWHHYAVTYREAEVQVYVDGQPVGACARSLEPQTTVSSHIGAPLPSTPIGARSLAGVVDEAEVYSRALSESEIQTIFAAGSAGKCRGPLTLRQLIADVPALKLKRGTSNSLNAKLRTALRTIEDITEANHAAAITSLQAFINEVEAQRNTNIPDAEAEALVTSAKRVIAELMGL